MVNIQEYYENPAISQSKLKLLLGNPKLFNTVQEPEMYFEEKKHFIIGSGVDCLLTASPQEFHAKYHVSEVPNKPSDALKSIINMSFDEVKVNHTEIGPIRNYPDVILRACNEHAYQSRWGDELRVNKVCEYWEYWEDLKQAIGKKVLSQEENDLISQIVMSIRTNEATSKYFQEDRLIEIIFQMSIDFTYERIDCKALLDMVIVNHKDKTIQPIDIKTMGDYTINFPKSLRQRRYDIQAAFYVEALKSKEVYATYEILPFKFIVESTIDPGNPLVFTCSQELLNIGKFGRPAYKIIGNLIGAKLGDKNQIIFLPYEEIKGFNQLVEDYKYYLQNGFELDKRVRDNSSELLLDWSGINLKG